MRSINPEVYLAVVRHELSSFGVGFRPTTMSMSVRVPNEYIVVPYGIVLDETT
jgi:hypothetical protein